MYKKLLFLLILLCSIPSISQEITRITIQGKITAAKGEDVEGINIYNKSSEKGTVTSKEGVFQIRVAENDRVLISAMQFQSFIVIVDKGILKAGGMNIYLNTVINQLDEVIIRSYDISGNIVADVKRISIIHIDADWDLSYETLQFGYDFAPDSQSAISGNKAEEAYFNSSVPVGGNILGLAGLFFKKKKTEKQLITETDMVTKAVQSRFGINYISNTFNIPEDKVNEFVYFVEENGIDKNLLRSENELQLFEFIQKQSEVYLLQSKEN